MHGLMLHKNSELKSEFGFTLIEVMISIVIMMVGLLGMFQVINVAMDKNIENQLRQSAIAVAEQQLNSLKARSFSNVTGNTSMHLPVASGPVSKDLLIERRITDLAVSDSKTKQVSIRVSWSYRGKTYEHQSATAIGSTELSTGN